MKIVFLMLLIAVGFGLAVAEPKKIPCQWEKTGSIVSMIECNN